jgi:Putative zinc-finger
MSDICKDKELLVEWLYGETEPPRRAEMEAHVNSCSRCLEELAGLRGVRAALAEIRDRKPAPETSPTVLVLGRPRPPAPLRWAGLAAAAALILVSTLVLSGTRLEWTGSGPAVSFGGRGASQNLDRIQEAADAAVHAMRQEAKEQRELLATTLLAELERRDTQGDDGLREVLGALVRDLNQQRARDMDFMLGQIDSLEMRTGQEMARTNQILEFAVLTSNPAVALER